MRLNLNKDMITDINGTFGISQERTEEIDEIIDKVTTEIMDREDGFTPMETLTAVAEAIGDVTAEEIYYTGIMLGMYNEGHRQHIEKCREVASVFERILQ